MSVVAVANLWDRAPIAGQPITVGWTDLDAHSRVLHQPGWLHGAAELFDRLGAEIVWRDETRPMYDQVVAVPRLTASVALASLDQDHPMVTLARDLQTELGARFGRAGLNLYRDGNDSVAWHRDRIGRQRHDSTVALVSLGGPRTLALRPYRRTRGGTRSTSGPARRFVLGSGDLFVMAGACQRDWEHRVPKTARAEPRISIGLRSLGPARQRGWTGPAGFDPTCRVNDGAPEVRRGSPI